VLLWEALRDRIEKQQTTPIKSTQVQPLPFDRRCVAVTKSGRRCRGKKRKGMDYCPFHDPTLSDNRRRQIAAKGGRNHHRLSRLPDGYLRKLNSRASVGEALDRLYREVRLGIVSPDMGRVLFDVLTRLLDSGLYDQATAEPVSPRTRAGRIRPRLGELLTQAEKRAWRKAVADAARSAEAARARHQRTAKARPAGTQRDRSDRRAASADGALQFA
jgi:hypothetical protein